MTIKEINFDYQSGLESSTYINAANKYNDSVKELRIAMLLASIEHVESLMKAASNARITDDINGTTNSLYYPIIDRCELIREHLNEVIRSL